jgi:carboxypeptidase C (cathepsin A)
MSLFSGAYGDLIKSYLADGLKYKTDLKYAASGQVNPWSYGKAGNNRYANVAPRLKTALEKDAKLRVFVASGYMDLATPYAATDYTFAHMGPRTLMNRVTMKYYEAGHMMYSHQPSLRRLREDLAKFVAPLPGNVGEGSKALALNLVPTYDRLVGRLP